MEQGFNTEKVRVRDTQVCRVLRLRRRSTCVSGYDYAGQGIVLVMDY
jgi:hypothetical protein